MRLLLDTHLLIWCLDSPQRLDITTMAAIEDIGNEVLFSAASIWEIAIKTALGRADFKIRPEAVAQEARDVGFTELPVRSDVRRELQICRCIMATHSTGCLWRRRWPSPPGSIRLIRCFPSIQTSSGWCGSTPRGPAGKHD